MLYRSGTSVGRRDGTPNQFKTVCRLLVGASCGVEALEGSIGLVGQHAWRYRGNGGPDRSGGPTRSLFCWLTIAFARVIHDPRAVLVEISRHAFSCAAVLVCRADPSAEPRARRSVQLRPVIGERLLVPLGIAAFFVRTVGPCGRVTTGCQSF